LPSEKKGWQLCEAMSQTVSWGSVVLSISLRFAKVANVPGDVNQRIIHWHMIHSRVSGLPVKTAVCGCLTSQEAA
jgi:hypothetical protein